MNAIAKPASRDVDKRQRHERNKCQDWVGIKQNCSDGNDLNHIGQRDGDHHDEALNLHQVARCTTHQLPSLGFVVIANIQTNQVGKETLSQQCFGPSTFTKCHIAAHTREQTSQHAKPSDDQNPLEQWTIFFDALVNCIFGHLWNCGFEACPRDTDHCTKK